MTHLEAIFGKRQRLGSDCLAGHPPLFSFLLNIFSVGFALRRAVGLVAVDRLLPDATGGMT